MITMKINYYIDESGVEDWEREKYFTISVCAVNEKNETKIKEKFDQFKDTYSKKLGQRIKYLHGSEVTLGLNQGKGVYGRLHGNPKLQRSFFQDLNSLLSSSDYQLLAFSLNLKDYLVVLNARLYEYYSQRRETFSINQIFNTFIYPTSLLQGVELIRRHINSQKTKLQSINIFIEEKNSDITITTKYAEKRLSDVLDKLIPNVAKEDKNYGAGFEIADLAANAISRAVENNERKDYKAIKDKIIEYKYVDMKTMHEYVPKFEK